MITNGIFLYRLQTKPSQGLKTVNSNAFLLNFFALYEIFWVYMHMSAN